MLAMLLLIVGVVAAYASTRTRRASFVVMALACLALGLAANAVYRGLAGIIDAVWIVAVLAIAVSFLGARYWEAR